MQLRKRISLIVVALSVFSFAQIATASTWTNLPIDGSNKIIWGYGLNTSGTITQSGVPILIGNQTVTLAGAVTGSGATSITTIYTTSTLYGFFSAGGTGLTYSTSTGQFTWTNPGYITAAPATSTITASGTTITGPAFTFASTSIIQPYASGTGIYWAFINPGYISTSTYNASMTIAVAAPITGGGALTNNSTISLGFNTSTPLTLSGQYTFGATTTILNGATSGMTSSTNPLLAIVPQAWTGGNVSGTLLGTNVTGTYNGDLFNLMSSSTSRLKLSSSGVLTYPNVKSALELADANGVLTAYAGSSNPCSANQAPTTISALGALGGCTSTFLTGNQTITFTASGDATGTASGATSIADSLTVTGLQGKALPSLATGTLKYSGSTWAMDASALDNGTGTSPLFNNINASGTINASTSITIGGTAVSTSTGANPTASIGTSAVNGSANTFLRSDGAPALGTQFASSTVTFNIYDATTTAPYRFAQSCFNKTVTISKISVAEYASAATDTIEWIRTTTQATSTVDTQIATSTAATNVSTSTTSFTSSTLLAGTCLTAIVTSTAGTPSWTVAQVDYRTN